MTPLEQAELRATYPSTPLDWTCLVVAFVLMAALFFPLLGLMTLFIVVSWVVTRGAEKEW